MIKQHVESSLEQPETLTKCLYIQERNEEGSKGESLTSIQILISDCD
jgi:hypothetical protein